MIKVSPSILSGNFAKMGEEALKMEKAGADYIHCDVMDGVFVPNLTFGSKMVADIGKCTKLPLDVHLMICEPEKYIERYIKAGASRLCFHVEATKEVHKCIEMIKKANIEVGLAICPETNLSELFEYLPDIDYVIIMGVRPGFSGQTYFPETTEKIKVLSSEIKLRGYNVQIEIDGGANFENIAEIREAGATVIVSGSIAFGSPTPERVISAFRGE